MTLGELGHLAHSSEERDFWRLVGVEDEAHEVVSSSDEGSPTSSPALLESYREFKRARKMASYQSYATIPASPPVAPKSLAPL